MTSAYDLLRLRCGLSQQEAADFHDTRLDTVKSWCSDRRSAPIGAIDELRRLHAKILEAGDTLVNLMLKKKDVDDDGERVFRLGLPRDDRDARVCGFPTASACQAAVGVAIAALPAGVRVRLVPRVLGAIQTAVASNGASRMTPDPTKQEILKHARQSYRDGPEAFDQLDQPEVSSEMIRAHRELLEERRRWRS